MISLRSLCFAYILLACLVLGILSDEPVNFKGFRDPNTRVAYVVASYNVTQMTTDSTHRSEIRVARAKLDPTQSFPMQRMETIQTLRFHPSLVDFDLTCMPDHCYLVCVTSKTKRNVELYKWTRTQFDLQAKKDSFARSHAVKMFRIAPSQFYIAIAQEQLHLSPYRQQMVNWENDDDDDDEPTRFIGCAVLKFTRGQERNIGYHQFIRLPFNPRHVHYFKTESSNNLGDGRAVVQPFENHYLLFSLELNWADPGASQVHSFMWNSQNDYFWPYQMPRGAEVLIQHHKSVIRLPAYVPPDPAGVTLNLLTQTQDYLAPVEACFHQLERLLADRDHRQRELIEKSSNVWRAPNQQQPVYGPMPPAGLINITAQVIVRGNVTVIGSLIESPQIGLFYSQGPHQLPSSAQLGHFLKMHSPMIVENKFKRALFKLDYIREKLSRAVQANLPPQSLSYFSNQIRFYGGVDAREVTLAGVANSNVRLNGIPFKQLENELVSLSGSQDIGARVVFDGRVVADVLEIHGKINDHNYLHDAIDITAQRVQVIDTTGQNYIMRAPGVVSLEFASIATPEVILAHNATMNSIRLADFLTRDNRTQIIYGRKSFKRLSMARLDMAHSNVALNAFNLTQVARQAIRLLPDPTQQVLASGTNQLRQTIIGQQVSFTKLVRVNRLTLNNVINQHINLSSLIYDSVKTNDMSLQQIVGQKSFMNKLRINRLTTEGSLNGVLVSQLFNLNQAPPTADHYRFSNSTSYAPQFDVPIEGKFHFGAPCHVFGSVSASLVNGVDLARRAVQRAHSNLTLSSRPQIVYGHKTFYRPLRVINRARLIDIQEVNSLIGNETRRLFPYPLVNNIDLRLISAGLDRQMRRPPLVNVDTLEIDGNLNMPSSKLPNRTTLGSYINCPLDAIRSRAVLAGLEYQFVETPIRVNSLRAKSIILESGPLNDFYFPQDFVLRTSPTGVAGSIESIFGVKTFEHLVVSPPAIAPPAGVGPERSGVILDRGASINQVAHSELQAFVQQEQRHGSTGEKVFNTMNVYGNLHVKRINDQFWPDDILLKSVSSTRGITVGPAHVTHKRIYSHLIFANTSNLQVEHHLYLRGPIQLEGRMNGVNLTEFSRQSATYYDKDLYTTGRPIRNKVFIGGLTVKGDIRSQGLIDGVNFDEMHRRAVTIGGGGGSVVRQQTSIASPKMFLSDSVFQGPVQMIYLNDLAIDHHLRRIRFEPDGITLKVYGKKTITGSLRINRNLFVRGLINGVDFADLNARAIPLSPSTGELTFNKTLTVEGDIFMDNLWIDERNGTIDGVRLTNLLPIGTLGKNELILDDFNLDRRADPYGRIMRVGGSLMDCRVSCDLHESRQGWPIGRPPQQQPLYPATSSRQNQTVQYVAPVYQPQPGGRPLVWQAQPLRSAFYNQDSRNFTSTRTTPPYSLSSSYQPPIEVRLQPMTVTKTLHPINLQQAIQLHPAQNSPVSIMYEDTVAPPAKRYLNAPDAGIDSLVVEQLESLRRHFISTTIIRLSPSSQFVVGFIAAATNNVAGYELPETEDLHLEHQVPHRPNYVQYDQVDLSFGRAIHTHLSVGKSTNLAGPDITSVYSLLGGRNLTEVSILPVTQPNSAMFVTLPDAQLLLLISQDYSLTAGMCPTREIMMANNKQAFDTNMRHPGYQTQYSKVTNQLADGGVYVFHLQVLKNSSSLTSTFFDLYQTLDLSGIDGLQKFTYRGSTYVLAISRSMGKIHLLLMRGYTAFQLVSDIDVPSLEVVNIMYTPRDKKPVLVIHLKSGVHRVMEAVII